MAGIIKDSYKGFELDIDYDKDIQMTTVVVKHDKFSWVNLVYKTIDRVEVLTKLRLFLEGIIEQEKLDAFIEQEKDKAIIETGAVWAWLS